MLATILISATQSAANGQGGVLTLVFPLVLVFIVAALWAAWWMRRSRNYP